MTLVPGQILQSDIEQLRRAGWNDESIHLATQIIGYFNYINRVADGLQVDEEPWMKLPPELSREQWIATKATFDQSIGDPAGGHE